MNLPSGKAYRASAALLLLTGSGCGSPQPITLGPSIDQAPGSGVSDSVPRYSELDSHRAQSDASRKVYVSEGPGGINTILIYPAGKANPSPIGKITKGLDNPVGMCFDSAGNLYVANIDGDDVTVYSKSHKLIRTIAIDVQAPVSVVVNASDTVYVTNYYEKSVLEFAKGKQSPTKILQVPGYAWGVGLDAASDVYVSYAGSDGAGHVYKFPPKSKKGVDLGISVGRAVDLTVDKEGDIVLGDGYNSVVNVYAPGQTTPTRQISIGANPYMLAIDRSEKHLYVTTATQLLIFNYKTGAAAGTITNGLSEATGVAPYPPDPL